ncbi:actin [Purpureocillium lavendulum]|uniref:Actin n=1 Tax=Purpureocillium lavendulum TaxID=1247861 RepID=A0AB34FI31_9HYPO|nr:actin [Purpureocillium lavendulum]
MSRQALAGMRGRCQRGDVTFTTPTPSPLALYVCPCTECRHQSSSAFGITALFPFFDIRGAEAAGSPPSRVGVYSRRTALGRYMEGLFCRNCGSRLLHRFRDQIPGHEDLVRREEGFVPTVSVKAGCLDGLTKEALDQATHIWCESAIVPIPAGARQWPGRPEGGTLVRR